MPQPQVYDAVSAHLETVWPGVPFEIEGVLPHRAPKDGSFFLAVEFHAERSARISIGAPGNNLYRDEGAIRFVLNVPRADGIRSAFARATELAGHFRAAQFGGVATFAPSPAVPARDRSTGNYIVLAFIAPYQFDHFS